MNLKWDSRWDRLTTADTHLNKIIPFFRFFSFLLIARPLDHANNEAGQIYFMKHNQSGNVILSLITNI
jgi:hypothetical protein